jgi:membrane protease YdiL (CAAX protease family)
MKVTGRIVDGIGDFRVRMTRHADVFERAAGERLFPGTLNVDIGTPLECREDFRILGAEIGEPEQDLLFERCSVAGERAYRIRPYELRGGGGGHGDHILEIASAVELRSLLAGRENAVEIEFRRRRPIRHFVRSSSLLVFVGLAFLFTWSLLPLASRSVAVGLLALFGPAAAAVVVAALTGADELQALGARVFRWRVPLVWYAVAALLPLPISALASTLEYLWGARGDIQVLSISPLSALVFVLVIGEEVGWRGFALPRLLARWGPWTASAIVGAVWALWHLPLFLMPSMPQYGSPFAPYVGYTIALSILLTWLAQRTEGSVVIATLFHGAVNTFIVANSAADPTMKGWGNALSYGAAAVVIGAAAWGIGRRSTSRRHG